MDETIKLLVRVDDAGSSWSSNIGCLEACRDGIATSIEVMMPGAWVHHAAGLYNAHPSIDVGVHLTLTSEWDAVKWRPLTAAKSLVDGDGFFFPLITPREDDDRVSLADASWSLDDVADEFRAQIALGISMFDQVSHVSSHMIRHFRELDPRMGEVIAELCESFGLQDDAFGHGLSRMDGYPKYPRDSQLRISSFLDELSALSTGTHIFIDHPAVPSDALGAMGHTGYEDVMLDRMTCLDVLLEPEIKSHINHLGIELISYRDLMSE